MRAALAGAVTAAREAIFKNFGVVIRSCGGAAGVAIKSTIRLAVSKRDVHRAEARQSKSEREDTD